MRFDHSSLGNKSGHEYNTGYSGITRLVDFHQSQTRREWEPENENEDENENIDHDTNDIMSDARTIWQLTLTIELLNRDDNPLPQIDMV